MLMVGGAILLCAWLALCLLLYRGQDEMIFHPQPLPAGRVAALRARPGIEELTVAAADGTLLRGWLAQGAGAAARKPVVIYYGGNADEVSRQADDLDFFGGWSLALCCYRGYGNSGGVPGAAALLADALTVFDAVAARPDIDRDQIVVMGRSIGTGLAAHVAGRRRVAGAILVSPYDRLAEVARGHYWFLPVGLLLRHNINAAEDARQATAPLLAVSGLADDFIPPARSRALVAAWSGPPTVCELPGYGHNDLDAAPEYRRAVGEFLAARRR